MEEQRDSALCFSVIDDRESGASANIRDWSENHCRGSNRSAIAIDEGSLARFPRSRHKINKYTEWRSDLAFRPSSINGDDPRAPEKQEFGKKTILKASNRFITAMDAVSAMLLPRPEPKTIKLLK